MSFKIIAHLDMDAFFAAVEERDKRWLRGLPVVVGSDPKGGKGRGVVSTANYQAREYGIFSALPITVAWRLSETARSQGKPGVAFIVPTFKKYSSESERIFSIVTKHVPNIQQTSVDEAYLDVSFTRSFKEAKSIAEQITKEIKRKRKLTCSIGIGPNKMIAKIASDYKKPNGLTAVLPREVMDFLAPLSVEVIPGIGPKTAEKLYKRGIKTVEEARALSWEELESLFGTFGFDLYQKFRGEGSSVLTLESEYKSIGLHETFNNDISDMKFVFSVLENMARKIARRLKEQGFGTFRTVVLIVRFADFETRTRSVTVKNVMCTEKELYLKAIKLALPFFERKENPNKKAIRMVGLRIEKLV